MTVAPQSAQLENVWACNPFHSDLALAHSSYLGEHAGSLVKILEVGAPSPAEIVMHAAFRSFVDDPAFPCLGARAALHRGTYRFGAYGALGDVGASAGLARDLYAFATERSMFPGTFTTFVATFREAVAGEDRFDALLWEQLGRLHELDRRFFAWDPSVSSDPADPSFSFSFAGQAFFVVGLHPESSRLARRFPWPALVFNTHEQFEELKRAGRYDGIQSQIRARDLSLQGTLNPNLAEHGAASEARQYSGAAKNAEWKCPFQPGR